MHTHLRLFLFRINDRLTRQIARQKNELNRRAKASGPSEAGRAQLLNVLSTQPKALLDFPLGQRSWQGTGPNETQVVARQAGPPMASAAREPAQVYGIAPKGSRREEEARVIHRPLTRLAARKVRSPQSPVNLKDARAFSLSVSPGGRALLSAR